LISTALVAQPLVELDERLKPVMFAGVFFYQIFILALLLFRRNYMVKTYCQKQIIAEREGVVEDLHDEIISIVAGIRISFGLIRSKVVDADLQDSFYSLDQKISKVIEQIRELTTDLRNGNKYLAVIAVELYLVAQEQLEFSAVKLHFEFNNGRQQVALPLVVRRNIKGFFKEAIHNCLKYAQAQNCWIEIKHAGNKVYCQIKDDGQGFDLEDGMRNPSGEGNGLRNFQRRAQKMQADYSLVTQPGQGVEIRLIINLLKLQKPDLVLEDIP
jgi:signal transduction histidine kinase